MLSATEVAVIVTDVLDDTSAPTVTSPVADTVTPAVLLCQLTAFGVPSVASTVAVSCTVLPAVTVAV